MIAAFALAAAVPAFMTFICAPNDPSRAQFSYVVSFERDAQRIHSVIVLWPNGSQSRDHWKGKVSPTGFQFDTHEKYSLHQIELAWDSGHPHEGVLTSDFYVTGGHVPMEDHDSANCKVSMQELTEPAQ